MTQFLKDVAIIKNGKEYKGIDSANGKYPIFGTGGIIAWTNKYLYEGESVLIGRKGTITNPQYINGKFWTIDTLFYTIIDNNKCLPKFLYYYLSLLNFKKFDEGTSIPSLTQSTLYTIPLKLPTLNKQQQIVDIIGSIDEIIENEYKTINILEEILTFKFKNEFSNIFSIGKKFTTLSEYLNYSDGYPFKPDMYVQKGKYSIITIKNINNLEVIDIFDNKVNNIEFITDKIFVKVGEILMSLTGNVGRIAINHLNNVLLNQRVAKIFGKIPKTNIFIYCLMKDKVMEKICLSLSNGTSQKNLSMLDLLKIKINFIKAEKIITFNENNCDIFNKIILCKRKIHFLKLYKSILLPLLINNQVI